MGGGGGPSLPDVGGTLQGTFNGAALAGPFGGMLGFSTGGAGASGGIMGTLDQVLTGGAGAKAAALQGQIAMAQEARLREAAQLAAPTPQELAQLQNTIDLNTKDIERKQKLIDSSDPALIEAGNQALALLQGKEAASLSPLKMEQERAREALRNKLRAQLGSGFENTTAGMQALSEFDRAAQMAQASAQQNSLAQLLGVAQNTSANYGMQSNIANAGNIANAFGEISKRQASALAGTAQAAGSQFAGELAKNQNLSATANNLLNLGTTLGVAAAKGG